MASKKYKWWVAAISPGMMKTIYGYLLRSGACLIGSQGSRLPSYLPRQQGRLNHAAR